VEGQLLQQPPGSRASGVRGSIDRRLKYAVGDLRDDRRQRIDGSQRDPARSECVYVVLLRRSDADTRPACGLHTVNLWQSLADADGHSHGDSHSDSNTNGYRHSNFGSFGYAYSNSYSYAYTDSYAYGYSDGDANADKD